jgi:hypothetical protein
MNAITDSDQGTAPALAVRLARASLGDLIRGRIAPRRDVEELITAADLPEPIAELVRDVAQRSRLWPTERAEIATELIAHFVDGLERGVTTEQLVGTFGDPVNVAKLIRRAKKRHRPALWRWAAGAARYGLITIAALLVVYVAYGVYFFAGEPSPSVDYHARFTAAAEAVPADERAWPQYRAAAIRIDWSMDLQEILKATSPESGRWDDLVSYLDEHDHVLDLARDAARLTGLGFVPSNEYSAEDEALFGPYVAYVGDVDDQALINLTLPHLGHLRRIALVLAADARVAAENEDASRAVDDVVAILGIARHTRECSALICDLVALAILDLGVETAGDLLEDHPGSLRDDQIRTLAHRLASVDPLLTIRLEGERYFFEDLVQRTYTDDGSGDGRMTMRGLRMLTGISSVLEGRQPGFTESDGSLPEQIAMTALGPAIGAAMASRRELLAAYHELMDLVQRDAARPLWAIDGFEAERRVEALKRSEVSSVRYLPLTLLMPAITKPIIMAERSRMRRDALLVALALELHHRQQGDWPETLDALTPDLIPAVPRDRFDGGPLRYAIIDGRPVLYSVGTDRKDDGGRAPGVQFSSGANLDSASEWVAPALLEEAEVDPRTGRTIVDDHGIRRRIPDGDWILWPHSE